MYSIRTALLAITALGGLCAPVPAQANEGDWKRKVAELIKSKHSYPRSAQVRGEQGRAQVMIAISPAGKVLSVHLIQSSGSAILDREALRIPMKVGSFPPPPKGAKVDLAYPITFRLEE